jgi:hypothetical protein
MLVQLKPCTRFHQHYQQTEPTLSLWDGRPARPHASAQETIRQGNCSLDIVDCIQYTS